MFIRIIQHILFLTSLAFTITRAQILDSTIVVDSTKIFSDTISLRPDYQTNVKKHNAELKDGILSLDNVATVDGEFVAGLKIDIKKNLKEIQMPENASDNEVKQKIDTRINGQGEGVYLVFDTGIIQVLAKPTADKKGERTTTIVKPFDDSQIFTHDGAIYTGSDGSIVATTTTTLLVITPNEVLRTTYESLFGKIPPFKNPSISGGRNPDEVFIRDETMSDAKGALRLELNLKTLNIKVTDDVLK